LAVAVASTFTSSNGLESGGGVAQFHNAAAAAAAALYPSLHLLLALYPSLHLMLKNAATCLILYAAKMCFVLLRCTTGALLPVVLLWYQSQQTLQGVQDVRLATRLATFS
jgi:hypothetical protein